MNGVVCAGLSYALFMALSHSGSLLLFLSDGSRAGHFSLCWHRFLCKVCLSSHLLRPEDFCLFVWLPWNDPGRGLRCLLTMLARMSVIVIIISTYLIFESFIEKTVFVVLCGVGLENE